VESSQIHTFLTSPGLATITSFKKFSQNHTITTELEIRHFSRVQDSQESQPTSTRPHGISPKRTPFLELRPIVTPTEPSGRLHPCSSTSQMDRS
jgi:hypothetical protein